MRVIVYNGRRTTGKKVELLRILLVAPGPGVPKRKKVRYVPFPQASLPLIAALTPPHHEVRIVDERIEDVNFNEPYDLVGITVMSATAVRAYEIAEEFRRRGVKVVLGGIHPTALPEEAKEHADSVVIGEAEGLWEKVLEDCEQGRLQAFYRRESLPSLSGLPHSRLDLLRGRYLLKHVFQTTRGCPHGCGFCSVSKFMGRKYRHRPVEKVVEEIQRYSSRFIGFLDDNIVGNPAYSKELFRALVPLQRRWVSQGTLRMAEDEELLKLAAQSGCIALFVGFESVNEENLELMHKSFHRVHQYRRLVERFHEYGIMVIGSFVFGFDEDDPSVFSRTLQFIEEAQIDFAQFSVLTPLPGTEVFEQLKSQGRIFSFDWSKYDFAHVVYYPAKMTPEELQEGYNFVFREFYSIPRIVRRLWRNRRYLQYFLPASLYYHWVASHPKVVPGFEGAS